MIDAQKNQFYTAFNETIMSELVSDLMNDLHNLHPVKIKCFLNAKNTKVSMLTTIFTENDTFTKSIDVSDEMNTAWDYFQTDIFKDYIDNDLFLMSEKIADTFFLEQER